MALFIQKPWYKIRGSKIYGVEWDGTNTYTWTRTDDARGFSSPTAALNNGNGSSPFDNIMPWSGMVIEEDTNAGTLVKIPKYYYKWTRTGVRMKLQISEAEFVGSSVSPAHANRGDGKGERDYVYVARYHTDSMDKKSATNKTCLSGWTLNQCRSRAKGLGTGIYLYDYAMYWTIMMLYLVEYANWNSTACIGASNSSAQYIYTDKTGLTDNMTYHTGTTASTRGGSGHHQYRHIEDLWGGVYDWVDGIYLNNHNVYCSNNPETPSYSKIADTTTYGYYSGYVTKWSEPSVTGLEYALFPIERGSGSAGYFYNYQFTNYQRGVYAGGAFKTSTFGAFSLYSNLLFNDDTTSAKRDNVGYRVIKLP